MAIRRTARSRRKQPEPLSTSSLIDSTLRWLRLDDTVNGMRAMRAFGIAAGPKILLRARAERLRGSTLIVRVASAGWSQQLHIMRTAILERMRSIPGGEGVEELRFSVGDVEELPDWSSAPPPPVVLPRNPVTPAAPVYEALSKMEDPELRDAFAALLGRATSRGEAT